MASTKRLFLLDGMALVYRAHFALIRNPITNSKGVNTSAIYGFTNTLLNLLETEEPTHLAVVFDTSAPTVRHEKFPEYKAQRDAMPEELSVAIPEVKRLCRAFNIPILERGGYEADDIIGTLAKQAEVCDGFETYMVTPDKDFAQLLSLKTFIWKPGRKGAEHDVIDLVKMQEIWGVEKPEQIIDLLGLMGDASDNIPGVPGVGPKTAQKLIAQFQSLENLLENTGKLKGKQKENLENFADQARLSKDLATIITDVPLDVSIEGLAVSPRDGQQVQELFKEYEFRSLYKRLFGADEEEASSDGGGEEEEFRSIKTVEHSYEHITTVKQLEGFLKKLEGQKRFCFDLETSSLDRLDNKILGIAFCWEAHKAYFVELRKHPEWLEKFRPAFTNSAQKIGHNLKFDLAILRSSGLEAEGPFLDTMLVHTLLEPQQRHGMDRLAERVLNYETVKLADLAQAAPSEQLELLPPATSSKELNMEAIDAKLLAEYAAEDADVTYQLALKLWPELEKVGQSKIYNEVEAPLLPVVVRMEAEGIAIDSKLLGESREKLVGQLEELEKSIHATAGKPFNLASPKQLGEILFGEMKLVEKPKKTKTGQFKTDEQTLSSLSYKHPIIADILSWREASKLKSTYIDALPGHLHPKTQRIHTHLHQLLASTGRMASSDPNLQNIPIRSEAGREVRRAFVPRSEEFTLLSSDYSQVELRVMAAVSGDPALIEAFKNDEDIHTATAARVYGVANEEVLPEMRRSAKMVNFGITYGISAFGLSQRLGVPRAEASLLIENYFAQYPGVKNYMEETLERAREKGYVETLCGRRSYRPDLNNANGTIRANAERAAINAPIQGTAADLIKIAMINIDSFLAERKAKTRMLLQVHDELVFDLHQEEKEELVPEIIRLMETAFELPHGVPLKVEAATGANWLTAH